YCTATAGGFIQTCLFTVMCLFFVPNLQEAISNCASCQSGRLAFERDLQAGIPSFILAERHGILLLPGLDPLTAEEIMAAALPGLHNAGAQGFRSLRPDPAYRELPLPVEPVTARQRPRKDGAPDRSGNQVNPSFLTFPLETREFVYGIRLKLSCSSTSSSPALIRVRWGSNDDSGEKNTEGQLKSTWETEVEPQAKKLTVWVNEPIKQFTVSLDAKSCSIW